jgi:hypothetical protein
MEEVRGETANPLLPSHFGPLTSYFIGPPL